MTKQARAAMARETKRGFSNPNSSQTPIPSQFVNFLESSTLPITQTGHNFNQWSHSVLVFVGGKGKEEYLTGTSQQLEENSPRYRNLKVENNMVMSWILNLMGNKTGETFMHYKTVKKI